MPLISFPRKTVVTLKITITLHTPFLIIIKGKPTPNGPILTEYKTLKTMVSSSAEAERGGAFRNAQNVI